MKALYLTVLLLTSAFMLAVQGQSYSIEWFKISSGGGTSTNSQYLLSGTIGQPDAGRMSGGDYSLTGGFWSLVAVVPTGDEPRLSARRSGNNVIVSWPYPSTGFILQQRNSLNSGTWTTSGYAITNDGSINSITIPSPTGNLFFRLMK